MKLIETATLQATLVDHVAHAVLTRPELLNGVDEAMHDDFRALLAAVDAEPKVRCLLLSSTGRAFSAGGDAGWMQRVNADPAEGRRMIQEGYRLMMSLLDLRAPFVCAVQGAAMGLGANIAFAADAVVAVRGARFADSHVRMGLVAGDGGVVVWPASMGIIRARRHLLTGDPITAEEGYQLGMVTDLVDDEAELMTAATALAQRIADLPPLAVQGTKKALNRLIQQRAGEVFELSLQLELDSMGSADLLEATSAFLERRPPGHFEGR